MKRSEIITHYKVFFGLEDLGDMPLGENDNLMIAWAQTLLEDVKKAECVDPWTASHVVDQTHGKKIIIVGPSGHAAALTVEVINAISAENGGIIEVISATEPEELKRPRPGDFTLDMIPSPIDTFNSFKTKRTNHERQPASFGKGKNKMRHK